MRVDPFTDTVARALALMAEVMANPKPVTPNLVKAWVLVLRQAGVTVEEVEPTVGRIMSAQTFFPSPADFLKLVHPPEDKEAAEELAWQRVLTCLRQHGGRASLVAADLGNDAGALWALSRVGFDRMGRELSEENRSIWRADFVRLYRTGRATNARLEYLPGTWERENLARGYDLTPRLAGRPDWKQLPAEREALQALPEGEGLQPVQRALAESAAA